MECIKKLKKIQEMCFPYFEFSRVCWIQNDIPFFI